MQRARDDHAAGERRDHARRDAEAERSGEAERQRRERADDRARHRDGERHRGEIEFVPCGRAARGDAAAAGANRSARPATTRTRRSCRNPDRPSYCIAKSRRARQELLRMARGRSSKLPQPPREFSRGEPIRRSEIMTQAPTKRPFDDIRALIAAMPGPDTAAIAAVKARDAVLTKPPGQPRAPRKPRRMARRLAGPLAADGRAPPRRGLRRQSRRHPEGRFGLSVERHPADGRELRRGRRRHQSALRQLRSRPQGLRSRPRFADRRHHRGGRARRDGLCRHHGVRHGGDRRAASTSWRSARWASATPRSRPRSTRRSSAGRPPPGSGAAPASTMKGSCARPRPSRPRWRIMPASSPIRSRCCAASAGARSRRSPARSWRRARSAFPSCSTAMW